MKIGIDFGTTNSAVAVLRPDGTPQILELEPGERTQRTVIYSGPQGGIEFGNAAFASYQEEDLAGRFLRSIKAFLPHDVPKTALSGRLYSFTDLVGAYIGYLLRRTEAITGETVTDVVVGRPVHFHADPIKDALAEERLGEAVRSAGIQSFRFQLEPVAAAHRYEHSLSEDRLVLVGDCGGGTADFAVLRAGPDRAKASDRSDDILATSGVAKAGDALDTRFMDAFLMHHFGRGEPYLPRYKTERVPWSHYTLKDVQALHKVHFLRNNTLERELDWVAKQVNNPRVIDRLVRLIFDDLGFPMAWAIEATKRRFSESEETEFIFDEFYSDALNIRQTVHCSGFATASEGILTEYRQAIALVLDRASVTVTEIDDVFHTGGTSQLPFLQDVFAEQFGVEKLRSADSFTSVCEGLALS